MEQTVIVEDPVVWESEIEQLELEDRRTPPPRDPVVFVGSSTIRMWSTLARDMAPLPTMNRGFGGAQVDAVVHYAPRIVLPYRPVAVVLCAGENDLEALRGKSPERVLQDVRLFADLLADSRPDCRLYLLSVKPSPARAAVWPAARDFNELLDRFSGDDPRRTFVDVTTPFFDSGGRRRAELFLADGLHLSPLGYAVFTTALRPILLDDASRNWGTRHHS
jgi:lysophospholipase L1-like esterase